VGHFERKFQGERAYYRRQTDGIATAFSKRDVIRSRLLKTDHQFNT